MNKDREKITALVTCFNEEDNIQDCLESVKWADEILVADSYSTDRTLEICRTYTGRIIQREYVCASSQRNWAIPQTKNPWILVIDSDERVSPELQKKIGEILAAPSSYKAFRILRRTFFFGKMINHCGWEKDYVIRLFHKDHGHFEDKKVHSSMIINGRIGTLPEPLYHYTYKTFDQYFEKFGRYTTWAAEDLHRKGRRAGVASIVLRPLVRFIKMYCIKRGFLDGFHGLILCGLAAFSVFTKYAKLWNMQKAKTG